MPSAGLRRRLRIGVPGTLLVLLLAHQIWNAIERRRFEAAVELLRASGARLDQAEFADPIVPDEENAALLLQEGHEWLEAPSRREARLRAMPLIPPERWSPENRSEAQAYLAAVEPYFALLKRAAARPRWQVATDMTDPFGANYSVLRWLQSATDHISLRVFADDRPEGRTDRAVEMTLLGLDLWHPRRLRGLLAIRLHSVRWGYVQCHLDHLATQDGFDAAAFRRAIEPCLLADEPRAGWGADVMEFERAAALWLHGRALDGSAHPDLDRILPAYARWWIARPWMYRDAIESLDLVDRVQRGLQGPPDDVPRILESMDARDSRWIPVSRWLAARYRQDLRAYVSYVTEFRLLRIVMALLERKQATGAWPETLEALIEGGNPLDPNSGTPFEYSLYEEGPSIFAANPSWRLQLASGSQYSSRLAWSFPP